MFHVLEFCFSNFFPKNFQVCVISVRTLVHFIRSLLDSILFVFVSFYLLTWVNIFYFHSSCFGMARCHSSILGKLLSFSKLDWLFFDHKIVFRGLFRAFFVNYWIFGIKTPELSILLVIIVLDLLCVKPLKHRW